MSLIGTTRPTSATVGGAPFRSGALRLGHLDAVRDDHQPIRIGAVLQLQQRVALVERDDPAGRGVADARKAGERVDPEVAQIAVQPFDAEVLERVFLQPVGQRDLDAPLVRVDAVLGEHHRAAGLEAGARRVQTRVAGAQRVIDARGHDRRARARSRAPGSSVRQVQKYSSNDTCGHCRSYMRSIRFHAAFELSSASRPSATGAESSSRTTSRTSSSWPFVVSRTSGSSSRSIIASRPDAVAGPAGSVWSSTRVRPTTLPRQREPQRPRWPGRHERHQVKRQFGPRPGSGRAPSSTRRPSRRDRCLRAPDRRRLAVPTSRTPPRRRSTARSPLLPRAASCQRPRSPKRDATVRMSAVAPLCEEHFHQPQARAGMAGLGQPPQARLGLLEQPAAQLQTRQTQIHGLVVRAADRDSARSLRRPGRGSSPRASASNRPANAWSSSGWPAPGSPRGRRAPAARRPRARRCDRGTPARAAR